MYTTIIFIILGFFLLIKGADILINGASDIAQKLQIPEIIIGLTIISIGTSLPELIISTTSAINGHSDMTIGNVIGSNISNLLLILSVSAIIKTITFQKMTKQVDIPLCLLITIIFSIICNINNKISRQEGIILILLFLFFLAYTIINELKTNKKTNKQKQNLKGNPLIFNIFNILIGIVALKIGGNLAVNNTVSVARSFGISEKILSITVLSLGTSLPELLTSISATIKGKNDIAIGSIIGSNIFNMLLIVGISAIINPINFNTTYNKDLGILLIATALLFIFPNTLPKNKMSKTNGLIYLLMYIAYIISIFI